MRQNYNAQTSTYGGVLSFNATISFAFAVSIPLYLQQADIPIRKPKLTEINTIPTNDEAGVSDWSSHSLFYGGFGPLMSTMSGFLHTPTISVTDGITGQKYSQLDPTTNGASSGTSLGLQGYSYGDVIWLYLEGKLNQPSASQFVRTDPTTFTDTFGNVYNKVVMQQFQCDYTPVLGRQTFNMTLYLEV